MHKALAVFFPPSGGAVRTRPGLFYISTALHQPTTGIPYRFYRIKRAHVKSRTPARRVPSVANSSALKGPWKTGISTGARKVPWAKEQKRGCQYLSAVYILWWTCCRCGYAPH